MGLASGWFANLEDPRYAAANQVCAPTGTSPELLREPSPARTGVIWGSLFRDPTCYTRFTGGLDSLAEIGTTAHELGPLTRPMSYVGVTNTGAWRGGWFPEGPRSWFPKLSAFVNKALGAANADRDQASWALVGPMSPIQPERSFAVPISHFWDQFPKGTVPPYNRQPGYVTQWPAAQMIYKPMGS